MTWNTHNVKTFPINSFHSLNDTAVAFTNISRNYASISSQNGEMITSFLSKKQSALLTCKKKKGIVFSFMQFKNDLLAKLIYLNNSTDMAFLRKLTWKSLVRLYIQFSNTYMTWAIHHRDKILPSQSSALYCTRTTFPTAKPSRGITDPEA